MIKIWCCEVLKLSQNLRLNNAKSNVSANNIKEIAYWILKIGDGEFGLNENGECVVEIPHDLLIEATKTPLLSLVNFVYRNLFRVWLVACTNYQQKALGGGLSAYDAWQRPG